MIESITTIWTVFVVLVGAIVGSFLNVVILRLPEGESLVRPGSHCPKCNYALAWYDNVPVLSWLALRGKCRKCRAAISVQYPLVEAVNALLYFLVLREFGFTVAAAIYCVVCSGLLALTVIDLRLYLLPDEITLPGIAIGLGVAAAHSLVGIPGVRVHGFVDGLLGVLLGGGVLLGVAYLGSYYLAWRIKRFGKGADPLPNHVLREEDDAEDLELMAMGGGDIKLAAMLGAFLGWRGAFATILLASVVGAVVGLAVLLVARKGLGHRIPFGPYLAAGGLLTLLAQEEITALYLAFNRMIAHLMGVPV